MHMVTNSMGDSQLKFIFFFGHLGVTPSMEPVKLDSMRERQGNTPQAAAPSVSAPTLSKLLAESPATTSSSVNSVSSHGGTLPKVSVFKSGY